MSLPYGRKRALEIATTLATEPELMLLDEPTQGMGHEDVARVTELISAWPRPHGADGRAQLTSFPALPTPSRCWRAAGCWRRAYAKVSSDPAVMEAYMGTADVQPEGIGH